MFLQILFAELDELIKKLYEGNATGKIPDKHFNRLLVEYDTEQSALEQEAAGLKEGITAQAEDGMRAQRSESAKGVGGEEPGTGAKPSAYASGEGGTAGYKGGRESFLSGWLI